MKVMQNPRHLISASTLPLILSLLLHIDESAAASSGFLCRCRWSLCFSSVSATFWCANCSMDTVIPVDFLVYFLLWYTYTYQQYGGCFDCCCLVLLSMARQNFQVW